MRKKTPAREFLSHVIGLILFLILLAIANLLIPAIDNAVYQAMVDFFDRHILLLIVISVLFMIGDIFAAMVFPFSLPYPIFNAAGGVFMVGFLFRLLTFIDTMLAVPVFAFVDIFSFAVYFIVFVAALIVGYVKIFMKLLGTEEISEEEEKRRKQKDLHHQKSEKELKKSLKDSRKEQVEWHDVGNEFRKAFYHLGQAINRAFEKKR